VMTPECPGCGQPAAARLSIRYRYPRAEYLPEAADPWHVQGCSPLWACGSVACEAAGLLAVVDEVITDTAVHHGQLLNPEDVQVLHVGHPGDPAGIAVMWDGDD